MKKLTLITAIILAVITATAQIINIPDDYPTIQQGIDAAVNGDTVLVDTGTYYENINFNGKAITLSSKFLLDGDTNYINNTIIDGSQAADPDSAATVMFVNGEDTTSIINGFTITGGKGLKLSGELGRMGGGIACYLSGPKITDNIISNNNVANTSYAYGGGIGYMSGDSSRWVVIVNNTIKDNTVIADEVNTFAGGIYSMGNARIEANIIDNNTCRLKSATGIIQGGGIYAECSTSNPLNILTINNNIINNNTLEGGMYGYGAGIACGDFLSCPVSSITNNKIVNNAILVGTSGFGSGIFLKNIQGKISVSNNSVQFNSATAGSACGAVIWIDQPQRKVSILNNLISENWASGNDWTWAAAIWLSDAENVNVVVYGNIIKGNTGKRAGGFYARNSYNYHLTNNVFSDNNVDFTGGAIQLHQYYGKSNPLAPNESIHPVIANNTFTNNTAGDDGGAIYFSSYYDSLGPVIFNNIFWNNEVLSGTGKDIYYGGDEYLRIENNNIDTELIIGNWEGDGNISEDPLFIDDNLFHIDDSSPCFNTGIDSVMHDGKWYGSSNFDFEDEPRPSYGGVDIGADEYFVVGVEEPVVQNSMPEIWNYPNPFTTSTTIEFESDQAGKLELKIYNQLGELIELIQTNTQAGKQSYTWVANALPSGVYFIRIKAKNELITRKLIKL